jgi:antitoxin ChpS
VKKSDKKNSTASLRRSGGSLILTVPQAYVEQNHLEAGSKLAVEISGSEMRLRPVKTRRNLEELRAATPEGLHRVEGWDEMPPIGGEG